MRLVARKSFTVSSIDGACPLAPSMACRRRGIPPPSQWTAAPWDQVCCRWCGVWNIRHSRKHMLLHAAALVRNASPLSVCPRNVLQCEDPINKTCNVERSLHCAALAMHLLHHTLPFIASLAAEVKCCCAYTQNTRHDSLPALITTHEPRFSNTTAGHGRQLKHQGQRNCKQDYVLTRRVFAEKSLQYAL